MLSVTKPCNKQEKEVSPSRLVLQYNKPKKQTQSKFYLKVLTFIDPSHFR